MSAYAGKITSLGDYVTLTTTIVTQDGYGRATVGAFDEQKERYIDGLVVGSKTFGRMSCPSNLYPFIEQDKDVILYTWVHPFLGFPPIRTGIIGIAYPGENRAYIIGAGQMLASLVALAFLPLLWLIPGIVAGGIVDGVLHPPHGLTALVMLLVTLSPWIAGGIMAFNYTRMKAAHPYATTPKTA
jgi:hypothetical protein